MDALPKNENAITETPQPEFIDRLIGQTVGQDYLIQEAIGAGARGKVYKAFHKSLEQTVAVKFLIEESNNEHLIRFKQEAQALTKLRHANIVAVRDFGFHQERPFIVMDMVEGLSLDRLLAQSGPLSDAAARSIFLQAAEGLEHAHQQGILHRDIKPANIIVQLGAAGDYRLSIVDFGVAKVYAHDNDQSGLTQTGAMIGTPQYMSPEQCSGRPLDARSDIYSLGCVMYEMVTGKPCVSAGGLFDCLYAQINQEPPAFREVSSDTPIRSTLEDVIFKCLAKDPDQRYSSAHELHTVIAATADAPASSHFQLRRWWQRVIGKQRGTVVTRPSISSFAITADRCFDRLMAALIDASIVACLGVFWFGILHMLGHGVSHGTVSDRFPPAHILFPLLVADWFFGGLLLVPLLLYWSGAILIDAMDYRQFWFGAINVIGIYVYGAGSWIYRALLESSKAQGTVGKIMLGLVVCDKSGIRLTFGHALMRNLARVITMVGVVDLARMVTTWLGKSQPARLAIRQVVLLPAHDWVSGCQVRARDDTVAELKLMYPLSTAALAVFLTSLGGHYFAPWFLGVLLVAICFICWIGAVHRLFMIDRARRPGKQLSPWSATTANITAICLMAGVQAITLFGAPQSLVIEPPSSFYGALGIAPKTALLEAIDPGLGKDHQSVQSKTSSNGLPSRDPSAVLPLLLLTFIAMAIETWLFKQLSAAPGDGANKRDWLPFAIAASLGLPPLMWFFKLSDSRCTGCAIAIFLAFLLLAKINRRISRS